MVYLIWNDPIAFTLMNSALPYQQRQHYDRCVKTILLNLLQTLLNRIVDKFVILRQNEYMRII